MCEVQVLDDTAPQYAKLDPRQYNGSAYGMVAATKGSVRFDGADITNARVESVVARGIVQVPEGRAIFPTMTVDDNLLLGAWLQSDKKQAAKKAAPTKETRKPKPSARTAHRKAS